MGLRFTVATVAVGPVVIARRSRLSGPLCREGLLLGALLLVGFAAQGLGLRSLPAARSAFLTAFYVLFTPLLSRVFLGRRPSPAVGLGLALAFAGSVVYAGPLTLLRDGAGAADLWTLVSALAFAAHLVALSEIAPRHEPASLLLVQAAVAAAGGLLVGALLETPAFPAGRATILSLLFNGLVASAGVLGLQTWAQRRTTATRAAVLLATEPVWAAAFGFLIADELMALREIAGAALILAGVLGAELAPRRPRSSAPVDSARRGP